MKVLVTGAGGFVGKHLARQAIDAGHSVTCLLRSKTSPPVGSLKASTEYADLSDREATSAVLGAIKPEAVLHSAARIPARGGEDAYRFFDDNVRAALNLLSAAKTVGVRDFVFSSSMSVYGHPTYLPVDERHPTIPATAYGLSKLEGEMYARLYAEEDGGPRVTVLRYSGVFGDGQKTGAIPTFIARCARNEPLSLHAGGRPSSDYAWVDDVARANLLALSRQGAGAFAVFNIGSGVETSVATLAELIRELSKSSSEIHRSDEASVRDFRFAYDIGRARGDLGFAPTPLAVALKACVRTMAPKE